MKPSIGRIVQVSSNASGTVLAAIITGVFGDVDTRDEPAKVRVTIFFGDGTTGSKQLQLFDTLADAQLSSELEYAFWPERTP